MTGQLDHNVRDMGQTLLRLRSDLTFMPQCLSGQTYYLVEDPLNSRFFRLGQAEYIFISLLDGKTTVQDALSHLSTVAPDHRLTEDDVTGLCHWLVTMDLAHSHESSQGTRLAESATSAQRRQRAARWNPMIFRVPLFQPDRLFAWLSRTLGWLYSTPAFFGWLILVISGGYAVSHDWGRFTESLQGVLAVDNWLWLAGCWAVLKLLHELGHGTVCRRFGGAVRETGILFVLFAPLTYVDVTSSWRFRSRWNRIQVAAAGMYVELVIAAAAALVWSRTDSAWLAHLCSNIIVMAGVTTIVFNANPLMKFDGYYILSDMLAIPNLYPNGQQYLRYWTRKYLLGVPATLPAWLPRVTVISALYGVASLAWRILVCVSLSVAATTLFHGAGIVLTVLAVVLWLGLPTLRFLKYFVFGKAGEHPRRLRFLAIVSAAGAAVAACALAPWPGSRHVPAVVDYSPHTVVRAGSAGFIREICVQSGQHVEEGDVLVRLENRDLTRKLADLELQILQSEIRSRQWEQQGRLADKQSEDKERESLLSQLAELQSQVEQLTVRATRSGKVVRRDLDDLPGTHLKLGDEVVTIGDEDRKELRISISQDDLDVFAQRTGKTICVDLPGKPLWRSRLQRVIPRASLTPIHPALSAANGGPLAVKAAEEDNSEAPLVLLAPRFTGIVRLDPQASRQFRSGQTGSVIYRPCSESIGQHLYHAAIRQIRERIQSATKS